MKFFKYIFIVTSLSLLQIGYINCSGFESSEESFNLESIKSNPDDTLKESSPSEVSYDEMTDPLGESIKEDSLEEDKNLEEVIEPEVELLVKSVGASKLTESSAEVFWSLSNLAQGYVEFGPTVDFGYETKGEMRFLYASHRQPLLGLEPETTYFYRVHSKSEDGMEAVSKTYSFKTLPKIEGKDISDAPERSPAQQMDETPTTTANVSTGWPQKVDNSLPMAGIFYGNHVHGWRTGNAKTGIENIRRFRAERTGKIKAIKYNNRTLSDSTVKLRCNGDPNNVWCKCVNAGLEAGVCGYTLSNSYSVGNGGTIVIEVREDNGKGLPSKVLLGKTAPFSPVANQKKEYPSLPLLSPVNLKSGVIYHLVYTNLTPPSCKTFGLSAEAARKCPKNEGASGLNGILHSGYSSTTGKFGPYSGNADLNLYRMSKGGEWKTDSKVLSFYEIQYEDGQWRGDSYHAYDSVIADGWKPIYGSKMARQIFKVETANRKVDGVWLNFGHLSSADGSSLSVQLKDNKGTVVASGKIKSSDKCLLEKKDYCRDWGYTEFGKVIELLKGSTYSIEFSAGLKGGFSISTYNPMTIQGFNAANLWRNSKAQYSSNGGKSWGKYANRLPNERDMALLFTIQGMPRQIK